MPCECLFCISLLLVPFRFRWFHLHTSEVVLFVTIAIANVAQLHSCTHSFFLRFSCFLCQFVAESISFQVVSPWSRWFQFVPGSSSLFQLALGSSNSFQLVPRFSMYATRHVRRLSPIFVGWNHAMTWLFFNACKVFEWKYVFEHFWVKPKFLNEHEIFAWNYWNW